MSRVRNIVQKMNLKKYFDRKDSSVAVYQPSKDSAYVHMAGKVYYFDDSTDEAIFDSWDELEVNEFVRVLEENKNETKEEKKLAGEA